MTTIRLSRMFVVFVGEGDICNISYSQGRISNLFYTTPKDIMACISMPVELSIGPYIQTVQG